MFFAMDTILIIAVVAAVASFALGFAAAAQGHRRRRRFLVAASLFLPPLLLVGFLATILLSDPRDVGQGIGMAIIIYGPAILLWIVLGLCGYLIGRRRAAARESRFR